VLKDYTLDKKRGKFKKKDDSMEYAHKPKNHRDYTTKYPI